MSFILGTIVFVLFFHTPLLTNIAFFYRGVLLLVLTAVALGVLLRYARWSRVEIAIVLVLVFCLNLVFFTHIPVTADRSVSVFLLGYLNSHPDRTVTTKELKDALVQAYVGEHDAVGKRLKEQKEIGTIVEYEGGIRISPWGRLLVKIYSFAADIFGVNKKNMSI